MTMYLVIWKLPDGEAGIDNIHFIEGATVAEVVEKARKRDRTTSTDYKAIPLEDIYNGWSYYV